MTHGGPDEDEGGESACFAHLICSECGIVLDGSPHSKECHWVMPASVIETIPQPPEVNN